MTLISPRHKIALCLYGNFNNRLDAQSGKGGFKYIKEHLLDKFSPDVFIYSSDLKNEEKILDLYEPWLIEAEFKPSLNFEDIAITQGIDLPSFSPLESFRTLGNTLAFLYGRAASISRMRHHASNSAVDYDWVIVSRFDLGQLDKMNGEHSHRVSEIGFHPELDSSFIYSAQWKQHNIGLADQWFFSSQENIGRLAEMYDWALSQFLPGSKYLESISNGIIDSNKRESFSNELLKCGLRSKDLSRIDPKKAINNHLLHKYFFIQSEDLYPKLRFIADLRAAANVVYTHSDYKDIWPAFFGQLDKHLGPMVNNYVFVDRLSDNIPAHFIQVTYDENQSYTDRLIECLSKIPDKVVLFQHEDMILYDTPIAASLVELIAELETEAPRFVAAKLVSGGCFVHLPIVGHKGFGKIWNKSPWIFSIQPTLWKKDALEQLLKLHKNETIWEFESKAQKSVRALGFKVLSPRHSKLRRGKYHWDNEIYPVISTAISKGKWVFSEYSQELDAITRYYGIDPDVRGKV